MKSGIFAHRLSHGFAKNHRALLQTTSVLAAVVFAQAASAQTINTAAPPSQYVLDQNGVNLATGQQWLISNEISIGGPANGLSYQFDRSINGWGSNFDLSVYQTSSNTVAASVFNAQGHKSYTFSQSGTTYNSTDGSGSTLLINGTTYTLTLTDGTVYTYGNYFKTQAGIPGTSYISQISQPNGLKTNVWWRTNSYCSNNNDGCSGGTTITIQRIQSVTNNTGYQLWFHYARDADIILKGQASQWQARASVVAINNAVERCDYTGSTCAPTNTWPATTYGVATSPSTSTDALGNVTTYNFGTNSTGPYISMQLPAASSPNFIVQYNSANQVSTVTKNSMVWNYAFTTNASAGTITAVTANPNGTSRTVVSSTSLTMPTSITDELGNTTNYTYNSNGTKATVTLPETDSVAYTYNSNGAIIKTSRGSKTSGVYVAPIVTDAGYPASCTTSTACAQPYWTKDELGNETDYTYDSTTGLVTSVTGPAAASGGVRPQTRVTYTAMQAYYVNSSGAISASGTNTYLQTGTSTCLTMAGATISGTAGVGPFTLSGTAACVGTSDERKTTISYGPQTAGTANNLLPVSQTTAAGNGSVSAVTSQTYDTIGNVVTMVGALGSGQTTVNYYDADRRLLGTVTPDPDGAGVRTPAAVKYTYNADSVVTLTQVGTVPDQTANSFNNSFTVAQQSGVTLDAYDRPIRSTVTSGSTTYAVADQLYDSIGRPWCSIQYMNMAAVPGTIASGTTCAPSQTTGPYGADRIAQSTYDADNRILEQIDGVGALSTVTYSANGNMLSALDGHNNLTSYTYDGFDRLSQTNFPVAGQGGNASDVNNYEALTYDAHGNVLTRRLRDGVTVTFTYDNLERLATRTPSGTAASSNDYPVTLSYNLVNAVTQIARSADGQTLGYSYDALGRVTAESQPFGSTTYQYDAAGDRTRITWGDGFYVGYAYDMIGGVTSIAANGATSGVGVLASYSYDNLGRQTGVAYGNGTGKTTAYDAVSRLAGLQLTFPATSNNDLIGGVGGSGTPISYTPSSQIAGITHSNDAYAWTGAYNVSRSYMTNGLNQYISSGGVVLGYDARGNLTSSGTTSTYTYDKLNDLATVPTASTSIYYDPQGRVSEYDTSASTRFYYAGGTPVAEVANPSGTIMQRYVPGASTDEVVAWYSGSGNTTTPQFFQADERGSIIAVTNSAGALVGANSYDEFGIPASTNVGRFGYTGQTWFAEVGLYNYKARWYSPSLGRFMQTDPIGYGDGLNWYNYAHGDPINAADSLGRDSDVNQIVVNGNGCSASAFLCYSIAVPDRYLSLVTNLTSAADIIVVTARRVKANIALAQSLLNIVISFDNCAGAAILANKGTLALDAASVAASFVPGGKGLLTVGAAVVGSYTGVAALTIGIASHSSLGAGIGVTGHFVSNAAVLMDGAKGLASYLPVAGQALALGGAGLDLFNALTEGGCLGVGK